MSIAPCSIGRAQPSKKRGDVAPRPWPISDAFSITGESTRSCSAPPTIGTPSIRSSPARPASMSTSRSRPRTIFPRGSAWSRPRASTGAWFRSGASHAAAGTSPRPWNTSAPARSAGSPWPAPGRAAKQKPIGYPKDAPRPAWRRLRPLARSGAQASVQPGAVSQLVALVLRLRDRRSRQRRRASARLRAPRPAAPPSRARSARFPTGRWRSRPAAASWCSTTRRSGRTRWSRCGTTPAPA